MKSFFDNLRAKSRNLLSRFRPASNEAPLATVTVDNPQMIERDERLYLQLVASVIFLTAFGFMLVYSALSVRLLNRGNGLWSDVAKLVAFTLMGLFVFYLVSRFRLRYLEAITYVAYPVAWLLQVLTYFIGKEIGGNRNWLEFFGITIQPSELLKIAFIMLLAVVLTKIPIEVRSGIGAVVYLTGTLAITILPVLACRDMGSALIFVAIFLSVIIINGISWVYLSLFILASAIGAGVLVGISPSRRNRVLSSVYGLMETLGLRESEGGYQPATQIDHARWAVGMGGLLGQGPGASREKWLYLPTADSDFIFAILCEEYGFVGALMVIFLFIALVMAIFSIGIRTANRWAKLVCFGTGSWIGIQAIVNIGVVLGVIPTLGVPLPFLSRGYSSLLSLLVACGIVWACASRLPGVQKARRMRGSYSGKVRSILGKSVSGTGRSSK
ncbi:putative lipid II flippase FtsW [Actinomycetaceae bacterium TAE3-ERU4]|nr:putative lipid II flippase FtsW [Actinomycetaceae bacterium TAE3-ERU4]